MQVRFERSSIYTADQISPFAADQPEISLSLNRTYIPFCHNLMNTNMKFAALFVIIFFFFSISVAQHHDHSDNHFPVVTVVEAQPFLAQAVRIAEALSFIGNPLPSVVADQIQALQTKAYDERTIRRIQELLDPYCLAMIEINPESRVKVLRGPAKAELLQEGWTSYLVKVHNQANITARLVPESPNALPVLHGSTGAHRMKEENRLAPGHLDNQFLEVMMYEGRPLQVNLSGLDLQYAVIQMYTREKGKREAQLGFNVGQGSQDIGFRNTIDILFDIRPSVKVILNILDENGSPAMASFVITDGVDRFATGEAGRANVDYRLVRAQSTHWKEGLSKDAKPVLSAENRLTGIYPLPARRVADRDEYPDFFFQPQVYRYHGEHVYLPPGNYHIAFGRGPEYLQQHKSLQVPEGISELEVDFQLKRWIHMAALGWYSGDHHIHAAGCSHYESPEEGVLPEHMWRQVIGEDLNMGNNLTWGPSWYHQKQYFTGKVHDLSNADNILRYDVEVSGFPSSHAGHVVLLNLQEDDYPNTTTIEEWPSWTLPVLQWAKEQGGITAYAHSGWGLAPLEATVELPNYVTPKMDGIGANEYVVTVTHDVIDFYSAGDTPWPAELNMWYHSLNCGFRTRISGETDFPCISDERVGRARIYAELVEGLDFKSYMQALVDGRSYVSDGYSHLIDFQVEERKLGANESLLSIDQPKEVNIKVKAAALLSNNQDEVGATIASLSPYQSPYWHIERARVGLSREVTVALIANGIPVANRRISADGNWNELEFNFPIERSTWLAVRIYGSSHTNPIFVEVDGRPIREKKSAEWCRAAVDQCWKMKRGKFREEELEAARKGYDHARKVYEEIIAASR